MTPRALVLASVVALGVVGAAAQQSQIPPPTVPPPVPPTTTPVQTGGAANPLAPSRPGVPPLQRISSSIVIIGQVVDAVGGRAVPKAIVRLDGPGVRQARLCDDKGRFFFRDLPPGDFFVTASKSGYVDGAFGKRRAQSSAAPITLTSGRWASDLRIELFRQAAVSGVVVDEANEPVAGARIVAMQRHFVGGVWRQEPVESEFTDDEGAYRLFGLAPGDYTVMMPVTQVTVPTSTMESIAKTGQVGGALPQLMRLAGMDARGVEATVEQARFSVDGRYVYWSGEPAAPADPNLGELVYPTQYFPMSNRSSLALPVALAPGEDRRGINFKLRPVHSARIAGHVFGPAGPLGDELVRLVPDDGDDPMSGDDIAATVTLPDGSFSLPRVPAGRYIVSVGTPVFLPAAADSPAPVSLSRVQYWGRAAVTLGDADVEDVEITATAGATLGGTLAFKAQGPRTDSTAPDPANAAVTLEAVSGPSRGFPISINVSKNGGFQAAGLAPGDYFVRVESLPPGWSLDSISSGADNGLEEPLTFEAGNMKRVVVVLTNRGIVLSGIVRDGRMRAASGATVLVMPSTITPDGLWNPNRTREARTTSDGTFVIDGLPPGDYIVASLDDGDAENWQQATVLNQLRRAGTRIGLRSGESRTIQLRLMTVRR
jgi:hypothetical protein